MKLNEANDQEKREAWRAAVAAQPPRVRFDQELRASLASREGSFEHFEFLMHMLELHPLIPFAEYTFGSELLNFRRAVAYEVVLRLLAHARSFVANFNIRNRPGCGSAIRGMLDIFAFMTYLRSEGLLNDAALLEKLLTGQSFATGADYFLQREWQNETGGPIPKEFLQVLENWLGLPRTGLITKAAHNADAGFSAMYARYSEYVHFVFAQPRMEIEEAFGHQEESPFGSKEYFQAGQIDGAPVETLGVDLEAASFTFQMCWPLLYQIDPFLADDTRDSVQAKLREQNMP